MYKLCSTHKLAIEQGRHLNEPRENRLCQIYNYNELEEEYHFVLVCSILSDVRRIFFTFGVTIRAPDNFQVQSVITPYF